MCCKSMHENEREGCYFDTKNIPQVISRLKNKHCFVMLNEMKHLFPERL